MDRTTPELTLFARRTTMKLAVRMRAVESCSNLKAVSEAVEHVECIGEYLGMRIDRFAIINELVPLLNDLEKVVLDGNFEWGQVRVAPDFATPRSETIFHRDWCLVTFDRS